MRRNVSLEEISDGRLYRENDMVKADCRGCEGCSECCRGMGSSIILDPYDIYRMTTGLGRSFSELLEGELELNIVDGCILPNLKMAGSEEKCAFLNENGRCSIHVYRPGICRLFPLGRYYGDVNEAGGGEAGDGEAGGREAGGREAGGQGFLYFLQTGECAAVRTKIKVSKWIDTPQLRRNTEFVNRWHNLVRLVEELVRENEEDSVRKALNMLLLNLFYIAPYEAERDFYEQFEERAEKFTQESGLLC